MSNELDELLEKISRGVPAVKAETIPDDKDIAEQAAWTVAKQYTTLENEWMLIGLRKKYGRNIIRFMWWYFGLTTVALTLDAFDIGGFSLPEAVEVALVGGTAVSVLGVVGTVAAGLFKPPSG